MKKLSVIIMMVVLLTLPTIASGHHRPEHTKGPKPSPIVTPSPLPTPTPIITPTPSPIPTPTPTPNPTPTPIPSPTPTPISTRNVVTVDTIVGLLNALDDNSVDEIVVRNGTYSVAGASKQLSNSLWISSRYKDRTRPILVRAETRGGVTFDGGGSTYFIGITFNQGVHDQTWDGFNFANGEATQTGVVVFGATYGSNDATVWTAPHHITLRHIKFMNTLRGSTPQNDHAIYISDSYGTGPNNILLEDITVDATGSSPLSSALHFYHSEDGRQNGENITVRRLTDNGTWTGAFIWDETLNNITIEDSTFTNIDTYAIRYELPGTNIVLRNVTSTNSGYGGFYSSHGSNPPGLTIINSNLD